MYVLLFYVGERRKRSMIAFTSAKIQHFFDMTKHYCAIFDADIAKNFDSVSPLAQMKASSTKIKMNAGRR